MAWAAATYAAGDYGTKADAQAKLERVVDEVTEATLASISDGSDDFKDRDLYVFCLAPTGPDALGVADSADASLLGMRSDAFVDRAGKAFGKAKILNAKEGSFAIIDNCGYEPIPFR